ncbi:hypothetical protein [Streptomyces sp. NPDC101181]|uniref:hypothetical protein n=1 Tax=Streptomyces sp. NPDC101181 TaxID=3366125 RepID=UPI0037FFAF05
MKGRTTGRHRFVSALAAAAAVLLAGCAAPMGPDDVPGTYRDQTTGGEIRLKADKTFSATDVSTDGTSDPADFSGRWDLVGGETSGGFVYLSIDEGSSGKVRGIQLYTKDKDTVYFSPDPDGPPSLELTRDSGP